MGNEALIFFMDEDQPQSSENKDMAMEYVQLLQEGDFMMLARAWKNRDAAWRKAVTYYCGFAPLDHSHPILVPAIDETSDDLRRQAVESICESLELAEAYIMPDEVKKKVLRLLHEFDEEDLPEKDHYMVIVSSN